MDGAVVLAAALVAVRWANSPWADVYDAVRRWQLGPLDLERWAADGVLTLFFYLAGLELRRDCWWARCGVRPTPWCR